MFYKVSKFRAHRKKLALQDRNEREILNIYKKVKLWMLDGNNLSRLFNVVKSFCCSCNTIFTRDFCTECACLSPASAKFIFAKIVEYASNIRIVFFTLCVKIFLIIKTYCFFSWSLFCIQKWGPFYVKINILRVISFVNWNEKGSSFSNWLKKNLINLK